ncbi:YlbF family regulator [Peptococcaceae bacterium]|nr:YlbF family regulator [Peptococcaceae bacterium]
MQTKEFKLKNEAEIALSNDEGACKLVKEFQNLKKAFDRMQSMGYALTKKMK